MLGCRNSRNSGRGSCVPQCTGEAQSLSVVGEVRRSQKGREGPDWGQGQRSLVQRPKAIVPGSVTISASQKGHLGSSGEGGTSG